MVSTVYFNVNYVRCSVSRYPYAKSSCHSKRGHYFTPSQFYCSETICTPCGAVIAWAKFAKSESPTNILKFLESVYPDEASWPDYCIDKACLVL